MTAYFSITFLNLNLKKKTYYVLLLLAEVSSLWVPAVPWHIQILADQLILFQSGRTDYAHLITSGTPGLSDLPTAPFRPERVQAGNTYPHSSWRGKVKYHKLLICHLTLIRNAMCTEMNRSRKCIIRRAVLSELETFLNYSFNASVLVFSYFKHFSIFLLKILVLFLTFWYYFGS